MTRNSSVDGSRIATVVVLFGVVRHDIMMANVRATHDDLGVRGGLVPPIGSDPTLSGCWKPDSG